MSFEPKKRCTKCQEWVYEGDFPVQGRRMSSWCNPCHKLHGARSVEGYRIYNREYGAKRKHVKVLAAARSRCKSSGLPYDLDDHLPELERRIYAGKCEMSGVLLRYDAQGATWNSPSIDRIRPELGYVYSNIRVIAHALNCAIGNWGEQQTAELMRAWLEKRT